MKAFSTHNYTPILNLYRSDYTALRSNYEIFIPFGQDNLLPNQLNQLAREVPVHRAILNSKCTYFSGKGITSDNQILLKLLLNPSNTYQSLDTVFNYIFQDYLTLGNAYLEIITDSKRSFTSLYHVFSSKVRLSAIDDSIIIHPSWDLYTGPNDPNLQSIPLFPNFAKGADGLLHSVFHFKDYEPDFYYYGLPSYFAGIRSIIISGLTTLWNQNRLENGYTAPGLLIIPGVNDDSDAANLDAEFDKFRGTDGTKSGDIMIQYLADLNPGQSSQSAQFIEFKKNEEANWVELHKQSELAIITIHNWFRSLTPYSGETTGFDANRIINEHEIAINTIITPFQSYFLKSFDQILEYFSLPTKQIYFINEPPIQRINPLKFVWEARRDAGLPFDNTDPVQQMLVIQLKNTFNQSSPLNTQ